MPSVMVIRDGRTGIRCLACGRTSYDPGDVRRKYCAACHAFHNDRGPARAVSDEDVEICLAGTGVTSIRVGALELAGYVSECMLVGEVGETPVVRLTLRRDLRLRVSAQGCVIIEPGDSLP
jgi:ribosomal protein L37E